MVSRVAPILASLPAENSNVHYCANLIEQACACGSPTLFSDLLKRDECWPKREKGKHKRAVEKMFEEANFLSSYEISATCKNPLQEDWDWCRHSARVVLGLAQDFAVRFAAEKKRAGVLDFHDLEQLTLNLLCLDKTNEPISLALELQERFDYVFVDEYQDINQAQDLILSLVSRPQPGNRFLVGDVKQSIYRFRQANPAIFQAYIQNVNQWKSLSLQENFRSHEGILNFINPLFGWLMQRDVGGITYDHKAQLVFGDKGNRKDMQALPGNTPTVELNLLVTSKDSASSQENSEGEEK